MTRSAALKLARYLRALGREVRVRRHKLPGGRCHYTVAWIGCEHTVGAPHGETQVAKH
jgi:hypothetical protein